MSASHPSGAATIAAKVAGRLADLETMPEMMRGIARAIIMSDLRDDIWRLLASRSSAPTFPPKPLLTDANAADRCVHGTYPPAICEHCQRQATTRAAPSEGPTPKPYSDEELTDFTLTQVDAALVEEMASVTAGGLSFTLGTCRRIIATLRVERERVEFPLPVPAQEAEALGNYTHDAEILRAFVRKVAPGGCKVVSLGAACPCPLCAVDRLAARLRSPSEIPEARRVRDLVQFHRSESCEGERCTMCGKPAAMKVGEEIAHDDPFPNRHNFTAYVCLECGNRILCPYVFASRSPEETPDAALNRLARIRTRPR